MSQLLHSRKFWVAVLDIVAQVILWVAQLIWPEQQETVSQIMGYVNMVAMALIAAIFGEDAAAKLNGNFKYS
jgi:hypothetical protein